jgi:Ca2+-binding EF-hand superfamily protein
LRYQLRQRLKKLRNEDKEILWEGTETLSVDELKADLRNRGLPTTKLSKDQMRQSLDSWIFLSQKKEIPYSMIILTNMLHFAQLREDQYSYYKAQQEEAKAASQRKERQQKEAAAAAAAAEQQQQRQRQQQQAAAAHAAAGAASAGEVPDGTTMVLSDDDAATAAAAAAAVAREEEEEDGIGELDVDAAHAALSSLPAEAAVDSMLIDQAEVSDNEKLQSLYHEEMLIEEERQLSESAAKAEAIGEALEDVTSDGTHLHHHADHDAELLSAASGTIEGMGGEKQQRGGGGAGGTLEEDLEVLESRREREARELERARRDPSSEAALHMLSRDQVGEIAEAVEVMAADSPVQREREELQELEVARATHRESIEAAKEGSRSVAMLDSRVNRLLTNLRAELEETESEIGQAFHSIDLDGDGVLSHAELLAAMESLHLSKRPDASAFQELLDQIDVDKDGKVTVADFRRLVNEFNMTNDDDEDSSHPPDPSADFRPAAADAQRRRASVMRAGDSSNDDDDLGYPGAESDEPKEGGRAGGRRE